MVTKNHREQYKRIDQYAPCQSLATLPFTTHETVSKRLKYLRDTLRLTYHEIAALSEFRDIPFGTIQWMYENGKVADIHKPRLRWRSSKPRLRASVNMVDAKSAAQTIVDHSCDDDFVRELISLLWILDN